MSCSSWQEHISCSGVSTLRCNTTKGKRLVRFYFWCFISLELLLSSSLSAIYEVWLLKTLFWFPSVSWCLPLWQVSMSVCVCVYISWVPPQPPQIQSNNIMKRIEGKIFPPPQIFCCLHPKQPPDFVFSLIPPFYASHRLNSHPLDTIYTFPFSSFCVHHLALHRLGEGWLQCFWLLSITIPLLFFIVFGIFPLCFASFVLALIRIFLVLCRFFLTIQIVVLCFDVVFGGIVCE